MKKSLKIFPFLIAFLLIRLTLSPAVQYKVIRVVDRATIIVNYQKKPEKVRLLQVKTPESVHKDKKQNIPMGKVASDYTKNRFKGKYVYLEFGVSLSALLVSKSERGGIYA